MKKPTPTYDYCFDFGFLFQDDDQSLPENNTTMMMTSAEPILDTNLPCMDAIPVACHQDTVGSNNKRTRVDVEEAISTLKRFKPMETLENPNYLLHQQTLQNPNHLLHQETLQNPIPSQPYIVGNVTGGVPSGYTVGGFGPTTMGSDEDEAISTLKRFNPMKTLENPNYLLHQENLNPNCLLHQGTLQNPNHLVHQETLNPMPSQPYIANNVTGGVPSGYTLGGFGPTNMAIFGGSRKKTPSPWTIEEHVRFLVGIAQGFKGDWKTISRVYVRTRTAAQVTSHAQKHFLHQEKRNNYSNGNGSANPSMMRRRRRSIYDIAHLADVEISKYAEALRYVRSPINN